jgi:hypothetical protein
MLEYSLDGLVNQFAVVLTAMTESESLLRDQVRRVRLGVQGQPVIADVAPFSPSPSSPESPFFPTESVLRNPEPAPVANGVVHTARGGEMAPAWMSAPAPTNRPEFSEAEPDSPVTGHRNYDYFSELDEKLTGLRQHYLE